MIWILYILLDAIVSWYIIEKRKISPNHFILTFIRGLVAILWGISINIQQGEELYWLLFVTSSFWTLFDPLLNKLRGNKLLYIGKTSIIDKLGNKYPTIYWLLKLTALLACIWSYARLS